MQLGMNGHDLYSIPNLGDIWVDDVGPFNKHLRWVRRAAAIGTEEDPFIVPNTWLQPIDPSYFPTPRKPE